MSGRHGDTITDPALERCTGCGDNTLMCQIRMDRESTKCCGWLCTHNHTLHTLALYGLLER